MRQLFKSFFLLPFLIMMTFASCVESVEDESVIINSNDKKISTDKIYSIPSPFQVAALISVLDLEYDDSLLFDKGSSEYNTNDARAINLGMKIIDFGYYNIFSKHQESYNVALKINKISKDLGLDKENSDDLLDRYIRNIDNKDSLKFFLKNFQTEFEGTINRAREKNLELLVLSGIYVEGLYISTNVYNSQISKRNISRFIKKPMKNMLFEQKIYLENILELFEVKGFVPRRGNIIEGLNKIKSEVDNLNIKYSIADDNSIKNIRFDRNNLEKLEEVVNEVRTEFINFSN